MIAQSRDKIEMNDMGLPNNSSDLIRDIVKICFKNSLKNSPDTILKRPLFFYNILTSLLATRKKIAVWPSLNYYQPKLSLYMYFFGIRENFLEVIFLFHHSEYFLSIRVI